MTARLVAHFQLDAPLQRTEFGVDGDYSSREDSAFHKRSRTAALAGFRRPLLPSIHYPLSIIHYPLSAVYHGLAVSFSIRWQAIVWIVCTYVAASNNSRLKTLWPKPIGSYIKLLYEVAPPLIYDCFIVCPVYICIFPLLHCPQHAIALPPLLLLLVLLLLLLLLL